MTVYHDSCVARLMFFLLLISRWGTADWGDPPPEQEAVGNGQAWGAGPGEGGWCVPVGAVEPHALVAPNEPSSRCTRLIKRTSFENP